MLVADKPKIQANRYVIAARWMYLIALMVVAIVLQRDLIGPEIIYEPVSWIFIVALLVNSILLVVAIFIERRGTPRGVLWLSITQIFCDVLLVALLMYVGGGVVGIVPLLFFIPIAEATLLFDFWGPVVVSLISGIVMTALVFLGDYTENPALLFTSVNRAFEISVVYLIIGFFSSYVAHLIRERGDLLARETAVKAGEIKHLELFTKQLEENQRKLEAKEFELTEANKRLANLEAAKSKFVSVTTHQLRTPLAAIKWTFSMFLNKQLGPITPDQDKFMGKGLESTERMIKIVNNLLTIDSIDAEKSEYNFKTEDLTALIDNILFEFTSQVESKKIKLVFNKPEKALPSASIDAIKVRMVIENLIDNAIKYSPKDGAVTITLSDEKLNSSKPAIEIAVHNTGQGIAPEDKDKIFGKFYRAAGAVKMEPDGTGLGLFIAKEIVEKHGGTIWFESEFGKGVAFHFTLPLHQSKV